MALQHDSDTFNLSAALPVLELLSNYYPRI